jgi:murein L,D-transpeptidase YcbB/YkuD
MELAEFLLRDDPQWTLEKMKAAIATGRNRDVPLPRPIPLHIQYVTAWVDEGGQVNFRNDVYRMDAELAKELNLF